MTQYLVALHHPDNYDPSREDEAMHRDIGALNQEMIAAGVRVFVGGLRPAGSAKSPPPRELALVSTKAASSGVIISTYRPNGPLRTGTMGE